jgi:pyridoxamine 5'-phosphate oxidase
MYDPMQLFHEWLSAAFAAGGLRHPRAVCVSTVDADGAPTARFVDLKEATASGFVFCARQDSPKGLALAANPHVALTFWWDPIERQVRVTGVAERITGSAADELFRSRSRESQLASVVCRQSAPLDDPAALLQRHEALRQQLAGRPIPRPESWGGYRVTPARIEFLTFRTNRLHERLLFTRTGDGWRQQWLEP